MTFSDNRRQTTLVRYKPTDMHGVLREHRRTIAHSARLYRDVDGGQCARYAVARDHLSFGVKRPFPRETGRESVSASVFRDFAFARRVARPPDTRRYRPCARDPRTFTRSDRVCHPSRPCACLLSRVVSECVRYRRWPLCVVYTPGRVPLVTVLSARRTSSTLSRGGRFARRTWLIRMGRRKPNGNLTQTNRSVTS